MQKTKRKLSRTSYATMCILGSALILMVTGGSIYGASSMTVAPAAEKFGVTIAETGLYSTFWTIGLIVAAFTGGKILTRFNVNGSAIIGGLVGAMGLLLMGFGPNLYVYYLGAALTGFPIAWTGPALLQTAISRWFYTGRATVIGVVGMAESLGTTAIAFLTTSLVQSSNGEISSALLAAACICFGGNLLAGLFLFKGVPEDHGYVAIGSEKMVAADGKQELGGLTRAEAFKKSYFWIFLTAMAILNVGYSILYPQLSAFTQYVGFSALQAATAVSVWSWGKGLSKIVYGPVADRYGLRVSFLIFGCFSTLGCVAYLFVNSYALLIFCAACFGILGGLTGTGTLTVSRMVGPRDFLSMALIPHGFNSIGYFFGPILFRLMYDGTLARYRMAWIVAICFLVLYLVCIFVSLKPENIYENQKAL